MLAGSKGIEGGDYRKADKQRKPGTKSKLSDTGFAIGLPMSPNLSSMQSFASSHGNAMDKNEWWEKAGKKRDFREGNKRRTEETTEKPTKKETRAVRAISATLGSLLFSLDFPTFPRHILLQRNIGMQYKRMNGRRRQREKRLQKSKQRMKPGHL